MRKVLGKAFFEREPDIVAKALLGKFLVRRRGQTVKAYMITETEAYFGENDKASHARSGKTDRNRLMFEHAGYWYVYFIYGVYWMLNIITGKHGEPSGVLIRGIEGFDGPGKLTKALHITKTQHGKRSVRPTSLWIEDRGVKMPKSAIQTSPRVGVGYAGEWAKKPFRFFVKPAKHKLE